MLEQQTLPRIERVAYSDTHGRYEIEPLEEGYGVTIGNALRRILLSSLPGAAITALRIDGIRHEFSDIPSVREDVTELMLNLKKSASSMKATSRCRSSWTSPAPAK